MGKVIHVMFFLLIAQLPYHTLVGQGTIDISGISMSLKPGMEVFKVSDDAQVNVENIIAKDFKQYSIDQIDNVTREYWVRFTLKNAESITSKLLVSTFYFDSVKVYQEVDGALLEASGRNGYLVAPPERDFVHSHTSLVPITVPANGVATYYLQLYAYSTGARNFSRTCFRMGFVAYSPQGYEYFHELPRYFDFFMIGALLLVMIYNIGIFVALRNSAFGYLSLYNFSAMLWVICFSGALISVFKMTDLELERTLRQVLSFPPLILSYFLLTINFLKIKHFSKVLYYSLVVCILSTLFVIYSYVSNNFHTGNYIGLLFLPFYYLLPLSSAFLAYRKKVAGSGYFLVATFVMLTGITTLSIGFLTELFNFLYGHHYYQLSIFIEIIIFSMAATQAIMRDHKEKVLLEDKQHKMDKDKSQQKEALMSITESIMHKNQELDRLKERLHEQPDVLPAKSSKRLVHSLNTDEEWEMFKIHFDQLFTDFSNNLLQKHPDLTMNEQRLCSLVKMGLKNREIAAMQDVTIKGVEKSKERLKKKLNLEREATLQDYLLGLG